MQRITLYAMQMSGVCSSFLCHLWGSSHLLNYTIYKELFNAFHLWRQSQRTTTTSLSSSHASKFCVVLTHPPMPTPPPTSTHPPIPPSPPSPPPPPRPQGQFLTLCLRWLGTHNRHSALHHALPPFLKDFNGLWGVSFLYWTFGFFLSVVVLWLMFTLHVFCWFI